MDQILERLTERSDPEHTPQGRHALTFAERTGGAVHRERRTAAIAGRVPLQFD
jgi:hypothetical protein